MKNYLVLLLVCFSVALSAQTAKVIPLTPNDAAQAAALHNALETAKKAVEDFDARIVKDYTFCVGKCDFSSMAGGSYKKGWGGGVEYSEDWKFIVPKYSGSGVITTSGTITTWPCNLNATPNLGNLTTAPAYYTIQ